MEFSVEAINQYLNGLAKDGIKPGGPLIDYVDWGPQPAILTEELKRYLWESIHGHIKSFPFNAILVSELRRKKGELPYIDVSFDDDALWRDSLYQPDETPKWKNYSVRNGAYGTDNIVKMFEKGWSAHNHVYGLWLHNGIGYYVASIKYRPGTTMLAKAIDAFNLRHPDAEVTLDANYR